MGGYGSLGEVLREATWEREVDNMKKDHDPALVDQCVAALGKAHRDIRLLSRVVAFAETIRGEAEFSRLAPTRR